MKDGQLYTGGQNGNAREVIVGDSKVVFRDNTSAILRKLHGNLAETANLIASAAVDAVQSQMLWGYFDVHGLPDNPHTEIVDTERLFNSITAQVKQIRGFYYHVVVGTDVPYAVYVHEGTYKLRGRPFITDGLARAKPEINRIAREAMRKGF